MSSSEFDLVVIGGGPAGEKGAAQAAYFGKRVALVEVASAPGGAAVHTGTLPSKTLRETAIYLSGYRARDLYGVSVRLDDPHAAVPRLIARKDAIACAETQRIHANLERHSVKYFHGRGRMAGAHHVEVVAADGSVTDRLFTEYTLIATGSVPRRPPDIPIEDPEVYDSDEILQISRLPQALTVVGAGVIGCEYACMFAALGVKVTLVEARPEILGFIDREIAKRLMDAMRRLGIEFRLGTKWTKISREGADILCGFEVGSSLGADALLFAAGRVGNSTGLGLEGLGVVPDPRGALSVDEHYRTKCDSVYAAGDVIGFPALASTSMEQARVAVCHMFGLGYKKAVTDILPYGIYTIPEVSCVGESEESAAKKGLNYVIGRALFEENARGKIAGDLEGMIKLVVERPSKKLLGVHVIGEKASELVHTGQVVLHLGGTIDVFIDMVFNYPTLSESYKYAAYHALGALRKPS